MNTERNKIRVGIIQYTNVWPVVHHFPYDRFRGRVEFVREVPAVLNRAMRSGEIDMGPISSFGYGDAFEDYLLLPDLSVSAYGKVNSILLFHKKPLAELGNGTIALSNTSATSVNLLKMLMAKDIGGTPRYFSTAPVLDDMLREADAALLIGDDAIRASWNPPDRYMVTDLGEWWRRLTGRWMTFAVWVVRKETARRDPELVAEIFAGLQDGKRRGTEDRESVVREAVRAIGGTEAYWRDYFGQLSYDFGKPQWDGLRMYYQFAAELHLLKRAAPLNIWQHNSVAQVKE